VVDQVEGAELSISARVARLDEEERTAWPDGAMPFTHCSSSPYPAAPFADHPGPTEL